MFVREASFASFTGRSELRMCRKDLCAWVDVAEEPCESEASAGGRSSESLRGDCVDVKVQLYPMRP